MSAGAPITAQPQRRKIVAVPGQPGERIDARIVGDVDWIRDTFKVMVTDGYAASGHAAGGEHPVGLAIDVVPDQARGGSWDDVDRLFSWAKTQVGPDKPFRWLGYDGVPGHGRGDHGHLSWNGKDDGRVVNVAKPDGGGLGVGDVVGSLPGPLGAVTGLATGDGLFGIVGGAADTAGNAALSVAKAAVGVIFDAVGETGARILLYVVLVSAGTALATLGLARAMGARVDPASLAQMAVTRKPATKGAAA